MRDPLSLAFVWHMHQPYYKGSSAGAFEMPWVRLHALKDYMDMVQILREFPAIRQTFNLVPCLVEQLEDYARGDFSDLFWDHTLTPAEELDPEQRMFVVDLMCDHAWHPRVKRHPRYLELARKKESFLGLGLEGCVAHFTPAELRDLQVWFNLAWFDPAYLETEPLAGLVAKDRLFNEEDKQILAAAQQEILSRTLLSYKEALAEGRIEVTTSPYFHPILPLLFNTDTARVARGDTLLPPQRFAHPEDALEQIHRAIERHKQVFGRPPRGMWCSEQAVGEDVIIPLADAGIEWTISDEAVLGRSLGIEISRGDKAHVPVPSPLYRAYRLRREGRELGIVFRDRVLSDLIGFTYQSWPPLDAAADLISRLRDIRKDVAGSLDDHVVTIALDGENAWEYYQADGRDFLRYLYEGLSNDPSFHCVTVSDYLDFHQPDRDLPWLHTGSWIYADLSTWIGEPTHSMAWDYLHKARDFVASRRADGLRSAISEPNDSSVEEAWRHVLVAEGSDWFWWFGEHQQSGIDYLWDLKFRAHLQEAYRLLGESPPLELLRPILSDVPGEESRPPVGAFTPRIDGVVAPPDEWEVAGIHRAPHAGTMQRTERTTLKEIRFGSDGHKLYLLLLPGKRGFRPGTEAAVYFGSPPTPPEDRSPREEETTARIQYHGCNLSDYRPGFAPRRELLVRIEAPGRAKAFLSAARQGAWTELERVVEIAFDQVIELALPLEAVADAEAERLSFVAVVAFDGMLEELLPTRGAAAFDLPHLRRHTGSRGENHGGNSG